MDLVTPDFKVVLMTLAVGAIPLLVVETVVTSAAAEPVAWRWQRRHGFWLVSTVHLVASLLAWPLVLFLGLVQLAWVFPLARRCAVQGKLSFARGMLFGAWLSLVANAIACGIMLPTMHFR